jgi:4-amino-4-deoxy-L-arabinose transferase-like glycosyltransferase
VNDVNNNTVARTERAGLFVLLFVLFACGLFDHSLWSSNDTREGAMIRDMFNSGTWVTPTLNGQPYLEKPPLLHWTSLVFCYLFGKVNEGLVRLPAAIYGFGAICILWLFSRRLDRERAGFAAAFMCGTSILYMEYSKIVLTDQALNFMVMLSLFLFWKAYSAAAGRMLLFLAFLLASAFSFYAKGLLGPGFVWVSVGVFLLLKKKWKLLILLPIFFIPIFVLVLAPWVNALWKTGGTEYIKTVFWANQFGRFFTFSGDLPPDPYFVHKEPIYFYLKSLPVSLLPWTLLVPPALVYWFRRNADLATHLHSFLRISLVSMLAVLHASSAKAGCYVIPALPLVFLMTAVWSEDALSKIYSRVANWTIGVTIGLLAIASVLIPVAYIVLLVMPASFFARFFHGVDIIRVTGPTNTCAGLVMAFLSIILQFWSVKYLLAKSRIGLLDQAWLAVPAVFTAILILNCELMVPAYDYQRTYKPFTSMVRHEKLHGRQIALAGKEESFVGAFTFYVRTQLPVLQSPAEIKDFLFSKSVPSGVVVKTKELDTWLEPLADCRYKVLKTDHLGYKCDYFRLIINDDQAVKITITPLGKPTPPPAQAPETPQKP